MNVVRRKEALLLLVGDIAVLFVSLFLTLTLRYGSIPTQEVLLDHIVPFSILFTLSILISFIAGLYEKHTLILKDKLPITLTKVQIVNTLISITFFYFIPYFIITPKITLFMYLIISLIIMVPWRMSVAQTFGRIRRNKALLIGEGDEARELYEEIHNNSRYGTTIVKWIDTSIVKIDHTEILTLIKSEKIHLVAADFGNKDIHNLMPTLYPFIFSGVQFANMQKMYEEIFDRVPLSLVNDSWFLENISLASKISFDIFKRMMDIVIATIIGLVTLIVYPFIYIAIKLDDGGPIFITQERVGKNNKMIKIKKFRTMTTNDHGNYTLVEAQENTVTRVGLFLRKSRLDEIPQLLNVFLGDLSLIGPRPELPSLVSVYDNTIDYYSMRHIIKPGLSGWAQIYHENHPHHGEAVTETKEKLSYDFYYIKNRSILLDLKIALQTLKVLFSFVGR